MKEDIYRTNLTVECKENNTFETVKAWPECVPSKPHLCFHICVSSYYKQPILIRCWILKAWNILNLYEYLKNTIQCVCGKNVFPLQITGRPMTAERLNNAVDLKFFFSNREGT